MKTLTRFSACIALSLLFAVGSAARAQHEKHGKDAMTQSLEPLKGKEFEVTFLKDMIHHHQSAVEMAKLIPVNTKRPELIKLGQQITSSQKGEIEQMTGWLKSWHNETPGSMDKVPGMDKMMAEIKPLEKAQDAVFDRMFLQMMIPHHEGAVSMSELVEKRSERPELRKLAQKITKDQKAEIAEMKSWEKAWFKMISSGK
ncbi:MAG: DUF305 domain-containing protein [Burkholderiaceae bacterium]|nr:DUF305 domain-containing protein [Burkholderiaceae bacterium]